METNPKLKNAFEVKLASLNINVETSSYNHIHSMLVFLSSGENVKEEDVIKIIPVGMHLDKLMEEGIITKIFEGENFFILNPDFENEINGLEQKEFEPLRVSKATALKTIKEMMGEDMTPVLENAAEVIARTIDHMRDYQYKMNPKHSEYKTNALRYTMFKKNNIVIHLKDNKGERVVLHPSFVSKCKVNSK